jgi:hypothetical protein
VVGEAFDNSLESVVLHGLLYYMHSNTLKNERGKKTVTTVNYIKTANYLIEDFD